MFQLDVRFAGPNSPGLKHHGTVPVRIHWPSLGLHRYMYLLAGSDRLGPWVVVGSVWNPRLKGTNNNYHVHPTRPVPALLDSYRVECISIYVITNTQAHARALHKDTGLCSSQPGLLALRQSTLCRIPTCNDFLSPLADTYQFDQHIELPIKGLNWSVRSVTLNRSSWWRMSQPRMVPGIVSEKAWQV